VERNIFLLVFAFLVSCSTEKIKIDKDELLKNAYLKNDYSECLELLKNDEDGIVFLKPKYPLLYDIIRQYLDKKKRTEEIETLFNYYIENKKSAFESSMEAVYPLQTIGSYLSHIADIQLLQLLVKNHININSPYEWANDTALFEVCRKEKNRRVENEYLGILNIYDHEKKERLELLLEAGANVTLIDNETGGTIFHYFNWWPANEDFSPLLDTMIKMGADINKKSEEGFSCLYFHLGPFALDQNTEAYINYLIDRGIKVTNDDIQYFNSTWHRAINSPNLPEEDKKTLQRIKTILEKFQE
jgi:hypothetical protein